MKRLVALLVMACMCVIFTSIVDPGTALGDGVTHTYTEEFRNIQSLNLTVNLRSHPYMEWRKDQLIKGGCPGKIEDYAYTLLAENLSSLVKIYKHGENPTADAELHIDVYVNRQDLFDFELQVIRPVTLLGSGGATFRAIVYECDCHWKVDSWRLHAMPECVKSCILKFVSDFRASHATP